MNKEEAVDGNKEEIMKVVGEVSIERKVISEPSTSIGQFRLTNVTKVLLDSIKRTTDCNA